MFAHTYGINLQGQLPDKASVFFVPDMMCLQDEPVLAKNRTSVRTPPQRNYLARWLSTSSAHLFSDELPDDCRKYIEGLAGRRLQSKPDFVPQPGDYLGIVTSDTRYSQEGYSVIMYEIASESAAENRSIRKSVAESRPIRKTS